MMGNSCKVRKGWMGQMGGRLSNGDCGAKRMGDWAEAKWLETAMARRREVPMMEAGEGLVLSLERTCCAARLMMVKDWSKGCGTTLRKFLARFVLRHMGNSQVQFQPDSSMRC